METYTLLDLATVVRSWGRGVVLHAARWDPSTPLALVHLGDTEGDITINTNAEVATLTTPEITGPAPHEADYTGEAPVIEIPLYLSSRSLLGVVSPSGSAHAGRTMRTAVAERTLAIMPEALFAGTDVNGEPKRMQLSYDGVDWKLDGVVADDTQLGYLDVGFWAWRGYFNRPPRRFLGGAGDASKQIETVSFALMHHPDLPEGHHLYTIGDPADAGIALLGSS